MPDASKIRINGIVFESVDDESLIQDIKELKDELMLELIPSVLASFISAKTGHTGRFAIKSDSNEYAVLDDDMSSKLMYIIKTHGRINRLHKPADQLNQYVLSMIRDCVSAVCGFVTSNTLSSDDDGIYITTDMMVDQDGDIVKEYEDKTSIKIDADAEASLVDSVICATRLSDSINVMFPVEKEVPGYALAPAAVQFSIT